MGGEFPDLYTLSTRLLHIETDPDCLLNVTARVTESYLTILVFARYK
jgi:hypothetical protein